MDRAKALRTVVALIPLAANPSTPSEEARTSAVKACQLIHEHGLLGRTNASKEELRLWTHQALLLWLDHLWENRKKSVYFPVRTAVDLFVATQIPLEPLVQEKLQTLVRRRASALRAKGVLLATRGRGGQGGFRMSSSARKGKPQSAAA